MASPIAAPAIDQKWVFLEEVFLSNSRRDSMGVRRGRPIYNPKVKDENYAVAKALNAVLRDLAARYVSVLDEESHIQNIATLANRISEECGELLNENRLVFGVAQKALNSYLKYLWCIGRIEMPPHCPFDSIIIGKLQLPNDRGRKWTEATEVDYRAWVSAAKIVAKSESLAEWELREWNPIESQSDSRDSVS